MDRFKNCIPSNTDNMKQRTRRPKKSLKSNTMQSQNSRWANLNASDNSTNSKNIFLNKSKNGERNNDRFNNYGDKRNQSHSTHSPHSNSFRNSRNSFRNKPRRNDSGRFNSLKSKENSFTNRRNGGYHRNNRRISRPRRSQEEFMEYMKKKHNATQREADIFSFIKTEVPKEKKLSKKDVKKLKKDTKKNLSDVEKYGRGNESDNAQCKADDELDKKIKMAILNSYNYQESSEDEYIDEGESQKQEGVFEAEDTLNDFYEIESQEILKDEPKTTNNFSDLL